MILSFEQKFFELLKSLEINFLLTNQTFSLNFELLQKNQNKYIQMVISDEQNIVVMTSSNKSWN